MKTRFIVSTNGQFGRFLSVHEGTDQTLIIAPRHAEFERGFFSEVKESDPKIINQKFSIHPSLKSKNNITVIKQTITTSDGNTETPALYTKAIKSGQFAFIYSSRCADLSLDHYQIKQTEREVFIDIGNYDPTKCSLYYTVIIGPPQSSINMPDDFPGHCHSISYTHFTCFLFWSFGLIPTKFDQPSTGAKLGIRTFPDEDQRSIFNKFIETGLEDTQKIKDVIILSWQDLYREHIETSPWAKVFAESLSQMPIPLFWKKCGPKNNITK